MNIHLTIVMALIALLAVCLVAWAMAAKRNATPARPRRYSGFRRTWRKIHLLPLGIQRLTGWLPGQSIRPEVQFANIGEGDFGDGIMPLLPDAATTARYLLYKAGSDADHCALCGAADTPLGPSDDMVSASYTDVPIAIKLLGAFRGTTRVVTDGTCTHGNYVKPVANGKVGLAANGDLVIGRAIIRTDMSSADGDAITIIPILPAKHPF